MPRRRRRAIELGGAYSGHDLPADINPITRSAAAAIAGTGLIGVAKDSLPKTGLVPGFCAAFVEIELDAETGQVTILDHAGDVRRRVGRPSAGYRHPDQGRQCDGRSAWRDSSAASTTRDLGLPANVGLYQAKPPSWLDVPARIKTATVDRPEPENPFGVKGVGEPPTGAAAAAVLCAISDALGGHLFNRMPVAVDMIVNALADLPPPHRPLQVHTV